MCNTICSTCISCRAIFVPFFMLLSHGKVEISTNVSNSIFFLDFCSGFRNNNVKHRFAHPEHEAGTTNAM